MKGDQELDLLADIVRLYKKYGPDIFERLASRVASPEFASVLSSILGTTARVSRQISPKRKASLKSEMDKLKEEQPEKHLMLESFALDLKAGLLLTNLRDMRRFAAENGLPHITADTRKEAIPQFMRGLIPLPMGELTKVLFHARETQTYTSSLSQWSEIITKGMTRSPPNRAA